MLLGIVSGYEMGLKAVAEHVLTTIQYSSLLRRGELPSHLQSMANFQLLSECAASASINSDARWPVHAQTDASWLSNTLYPSIQAKYSYTCRQLSQHMDGMFRCSCARRIMLAWAFCIRHIVAVIQNKWEFDASTQENSGDFATRCLNACWMYRREQHTNPGPRLTLEA